MVCNARKTMRTNRAFTLVEILTVIVIIAILVTLVTVAVAGAMRAAKIGRIGMEMSQIAMAIERYKAEFGEYPPDFFDDVALVRHVKKRWPRFELPGSTTDEQAFSIRLAMTLVYMNPAVYTPALRTEWLGKSEEWGIGFPSGVSTAALSSLCFWLGGFPDQEGKFAGFDADPEAPFGRSASTGEPNCGDMSAGLLTDVIINNPDKKCFLELTVNKNVHFTGIDASYALVPCIASRISSDTVVPIVYFHGSADGGPNAYCYTDPISSNPSELKQINFADIHPGSVTLGLSDVSDWYKFGVVVPYAMRGNDSSDVVWYESSKYQLIHPGLDGKFGEGSDMRFIKSGAGIGAQDLDNLTNFSDYKELKNILP